ncbi:FAD:protein FMN transferase [Acidisphaera sp. S103]|uniref:FAD:protein FMN transferase n=1 Tax=Acidisphaera sp. S103 TaxID=1747223 RepID=UPI00131C5B15|nr:FAD:protein FMN transferase [Acidisphaera sp. S103]
MTATKLARRRFIRILAAAPGFALPAVHGHAEERAADDADEHLHVWRGAALGADAMIQLHHPDAQVAHRLIARAIVEVSRLERVFSLYDDQSAISRLNRVGVLDDPPAELVMLLGQSEQFSQLTAGAFDATVQPLWDLYAEHFTGVNPDPNGPSHAAIEAALQRVGHAAVEVDTRRIRFVHPRMAITLNGIAQGYITDCIVDLLREEGIDRSLVDMGETRAIGSRPDGSPWIVGLEDPAAPGHVTQRITIDNRAVATSGGYGTLLDPAGRFNHIFNPATGGTSWRYASVSVVAGTAATADALSTAFSLLPIEMMQPIVSQLGLRLYLVKPDGQRTELGTA